MYESCRSVTIDKLSVPDLYPALGRHFTAKVRDPDFDSAAGVTFQVNAICVAIVIPADGSSIIPHMLIRYPDDNLRQRPTGGYDHELFIDDIRDLRLHEKANFPTKCA
tara:strand:+ start:3295 stop:3618 length:324 start_codon:yes stop_codon:yes gene_type:complete